MRWCRKSKPPSTHVTISRFRSSPEPTHAQLRVSNAPLSGRCAYVEAGADATFVEAPTEFAELAQIPKAVGVPQVANIVFGGKTPDPGREKLAELGFSIVLYANAALQAALKASYDVLGVLKAEGSLQSVAHRLASFDERQRAVAKDIWDAREARYRT